MAQCLTNTFLQAKTLLPVPTQTLNKRAGNCGVSLVTCRKKRTYTPNSTTTGGTQKDFVVDVWSGNHPLYLGNRSGLVVDADQVEKFGELSQLMEIPVLKGDIIIPSSKKGI